MPEATSAEFNRNLRELITGVEQPKKVFPPSSLPSNLNISTNLKKASYAPIKITILSGSSQSKTVDTGKWLGTFINEVNHTSDA